MNLACPTDQRNVQVLPRLPRTATGLQVVRATQSFAFMKAFFPVAALGLLPMLLTGCVVFPHGDLMAPAARGRVLDSETQAPIVNAKVVRRIERLDRSRVTFTDREGRFAFKKDKDLGWLLMVEYAANQIQYQVDAAGYHRFVTNLYGGGSLYRGTLPHDLGPVRLQKQSNEIEPDDAAPNGNPPSGSATMSPSLTSAREAPRIQRRRVSAPRAEARAGSIDAWWRRASRTGR